MFKITHFPELKNSQKMTTYELSWEQLTKTLTKPRGWKPKKDRALWSPTIFVNRRSKSDAIETSLLVFDIDEGHDYHETEKKLEEAGISWIMHTTASHTEENHKFRVILPIFFPVDVELWPFYYDQALNWWEREIGTRPDEACKDVSRAYFVSYQEGKYELGNYLASYSSNSSDWLDFTTESAMEQAREQARKMEEEAERELALRNRLNRSKAHNKAHPSHTDWYKYIYNLLRDDKKERSQLGERIGAQEKDGKVIGFKCPICNRADATFYYVNPLMYSSGYCLHKNSCGDRGVITSFSLYYLAQYNNLI